MVKNITLGLIGFYQKFFSKALPPSCRFTPTCSEYTKQAIEKYGFFKGGLKGIVRILHCHPFSGKAGYDPLV